MKFIVAKSSYSSVEEVLIPIEEISMVELSKSGNAIIYIKHRDETFVIDKETYYDLKSRSHIFQEENKRG